MTILTLKNLCVLLLVGVMLFPVGINQSYAQAIVEVIVIPSEDFAPDRAFTYLIGSADTITIPFSTFVNVAGTDYGDLTITFTLGLDAAILYTQFTSFTNVNATGSLTAADNTLLVTGDTVAMTTILGSIFDDSLSFPYTVTNTDGSFDRGVISFTALSSVTANPYTVTLPNLLDLTELDLRISKDTLATELLLGTNFPGFGLLDYTFTTNGTGVTSVGVASTGNASGTLTTTNTETSNTFFYTPVPGFAGTEAFSYTATDIDGNAGSSTLYIVVPARLCQGTFSAEAGIDSVMNGELSEAARRLNVFNTGNVLSQPMVSGEDWKSSADVKVMDAAQTRYAIDNGISYDDRTPLTSEPALLNNANPANAARVNAGEAIETGTPLGIFDGTGGTTRDNRSFMYVQFLADLDDSTFEGAIRQQLTITSFCPE